MKKIDKHNFEAVSLLTVEKGLLDVTIIPTQDEFDWVVPSSLIIQVVDYRERIWTYLWNDQEVVIFHLIPKDVTPDKIIILEGNTDVHRLGLQTCGELQYKQVSISDVKDVLKPTEKAQSEKLTGEEASQTIDKDSFADTIHKSSVIDAETYTFQTVSIHGVTYIVPELDELAHRLVDLDS
ncbi:hypothetical protein [Psychrobacter sp. I-STPA6b]|uniref:hypothetical protein n=1 Tax=Psychrobacter sp. I-STPA6b TaxID=2585718 RepID=UPI001D0BF8C8|nr:hypothetical protein [Psychrobacter sp. I-STPA6b]